MIHVGIDNGVTGSIAILAGDAIAEARATPVKSEQDYTKARKVITRVDTDELEKILAPLDHPRVLIERPMVNPGRFVATASALRCLEATLVVLDRLKIRREFIDSREWQSVLLPRGTEKGELKKASMDIGRRLFPHLEEFIVKHGDADGLLIAEYAKRTNR